MTTFRSRHWEKIKRDQRDRALKAHGRTVLPDEQRRVVGLYSAPIKVRSSEDERLIQEFYAQHTQTNERRGVS